MRRLVLLLAIAFPLAARADMLPEGHKSVKLSIHVDAELPAGKALALANTFRGADIIAPGAAQAVEWHPLGGSMQLRLIAADKVATIEKARGDLDRDAIKPLVDAGVACHEPFPGVRTLPESSPTEEIRWTYRVTIADDRCTADLVRTEHLNGKGEVVPETDPNTTIPPPGPPGPPPPPSSARTPAPPPAAAAPPPVKTPATPQASGCGGCDLDGPDSSALALLALVGCVSLRRRARRAPAAT